MKFNRNALKCYKKLIDGNNIMIRPMKYAKRRVALERNFQL